MPFKKEPIKIEENYIRNSLFVVGGLLLSLYVTTGITTGAWTFKQVEEYNERIRIEQEMKTDYVNEVNYRFDRIYKDANAETFKDSAEIALKYGLPIKIPNPTFEQKEEAIKQNALERSIK